MLSWIRRQIAAPLYDDAELTRLASLTINIVNAIVIVGIAAAPAVSFLSSPNDRAILWMAVVVSLVSAAVLHLFVRRGRVRLATFLLPAGTVVILTFVLIFLGGVHSPLLGGYLLAILIAGLLMGRVGALLFGAVSGLATMSLWYAEVAHWIDVNEDMTPLRAAIMYVALFGVAAVLLYLAARRMQEGLDALRSLRAAETARSRDLDAYLAVEQRRARQMELLADASRHLTALLDLQQLLEETVQRVHQDFGYPHISVLLVEERALVVRASAGVFSDMEIQAGSIPLGQGILGWVGESGETYLANDTLADQRFVPLPGADLRSELAAPLRIGKSVIGVLNAGSNQPGAFDEADVQTLQSLADLLAAALQSGRLLAELRARERLADALRRVGAAVTASLDLDEVLETACVESCAVFDATGATAWLVQGDRLRLVSSHGFAAESLLGKTFLVSDPELIAARAVRTGRAVLANNLPQNKDGNPKLRDLTEAKAVLAAPIVRHGQPIGVLAVFDVQQAERFTQQDAAMAELLCGQLSFAIHNARLFAEAERRANQLALLNSLGHEMTGVLDPDELCQKAVQHLRDAQGYTSAAVFTVEQASRQVVLRAVAGAHEALAQVGQYRQEFGQGVIGTAAETGERVVANSVQDHPAFNQLNGMDIRSEVVLPLKVGNRVSAVLVAASERADAFSADDLVALSTIGDQLAIAMEKARLFEGTRRRAHELAGLYDTALATSGVLEPAALLRRLSEQVQKLLAPDSLGVFLFEPERGEIEIALAIEHGAPVSGAAGMRLPINDGGLTGFVIRTGQPLLLGDLQSDPLPVQPHTLTEPARTWLGVPLVASDRVIGALSIQSFKPRAFDEGDRSLVVSLASQVSIALENARLYHSVQQQAEELGALYRASAALFNPGGDVVSVSRRITEVITQEFGFTHCDVRLLNDSGMGLSLVAQAGSFAVNCPPLRLDGPGIVAEAARTGEVIYSRDVATSASYVAGHSLTRSELAVPLRVTDRTVGVLNLESPELDGFPERAQRIVSAFGDRAALALENARLMESVRHRAGQLSLLNDVSRQVAGSLDFTSICERATQALVNQFGYVEAGVMLPVGDELELAVVEFTEDMGVRLGYKQKMGSGIIGRAAEQRVTYVTNDVGSDPYYFNPIGRNSGSALAIPLQREKNLLGVLYIETNAPDAFSLEDVRTLETLASHISTALENARLYGEVNNRLREMTGLQSMSQAVASSLNLDQVLEAAAFLLHDVLGYNYITCALLEGEYLRLGAHVGYPPGEVLPLLSIYQGISGRAARTAQPQFVRNVANDPDFVRGAVDTVSEISVPLVADGQVLGILDVATNAERILTEADVNLVITFAGQVTVAIQNARLFEAEHEQRELAQVLREAGAALSASLNYEAVMDVLMEHLGRVVPYDSARLMTLQGGAARTARLRGYDQFGPETKRAAELAVRDINAHANLRRMVQTQQPQCVPDTTATETWVRYGQDDHIRSWLGAPIVAQGQVIAYFSLEKTEPGYYQAWHAERLRAYVGQAGLALQNAQLYEDAERRAAELEAVRQASLSLTSSLEPRDVLGAILDAAFKLLPGVRNGHIFLYDADRLTFGAARWDTGPMESPWSEPRQSGLTYTVARSGHALVIPDMSIHPLYADVPYESSGSIVGLPLKIGSRVVGVMNISYDEAREYSESELRMLRLLGDQAALAIENGRLYQAEREQRGLAEALRDAATILTSTLDLAAILDRMLEELAKIIPFDSSAVMLREGDAYRVVAGRNLPDPSVVGVKRLPASNELFAEISRTRRPIVLADAQSDTRFERWGNTDHVRGWMGVPLLARDRVIAMLTLDSRQVGAYDEDDAQVAFTFAGQAAIAIENATLYEDIQSRAEMLAALHATAVDISIPHELPVVLPTIVERAARLLRASSGGLYLCDAERQEVRCVVSYNTASDFTGVVLKYGEGAAGRVAQTGEPLIIDDYGNWPGRAAVFESEKPFVAVVSAPLIWQGQVTGVIHIEDDTGQRRFNAKDLEPLQQLANQAAVVIEAARLLAETRRRADEQRLLFDATRDFTAGLDEAGVLEAVARHMAAAVDVYDCAVSRWEPANDSIVTLLDYDLTDDPDPLPPGMVFHLAGYPATKAVLETRQPHVVYLDDPQSDEGEADLLKMYGHGAELILPLAAGEQVFGVVELFRPEGAPHFTEAEIELAQSLAAQATAALDNASLHAKVIERARELDSLVTANAALLSTLDLDPLLRNVLRAALDAIPAAEKGAILLTDAATGALSIRALIGYSDERVRKVKFVGEGGYSGRVLRQNRPVLVTDAWEDEGIRYHGDIPEIQAVRSAIAAPLVVHDEPRGVLALDSNRPAAFTEADLRLLTAFANTAAAAIDNARLHAEVQTLAVTDSITGLTNRRAFDTALDTEFGRAQRYDYPLSLIVLDIDNFKVYNDTYGHPAGDKRLVAIGNLLRANVRHPDLAARYGGEEFGLILPHTDKVGALAMAERVRAMAEAAAPRRPFPGSPLAGYTISLGVATFPEDALSAEALLQAADSAELEAKRAGKNRTCSAVRLKADR